MPEKISLENLTHFTVPIADHPLAWVFESEVPLSAEYEDQLFALAPEAARFLRRFEESQRCLYSLNAYQDEAEFSFDIGQEQEVKKWLYRRGIPFDQSVFWVAGPGRAFVMSWKVMIKFWDSIFRASDEIIWDATLNWVLRYNHNQVFLFQQNLSKKEEH